MFGGGYNMDNKEVRRKLVDMETGEEVLIYEGDRIVRGASTEHLEKKSKCQEWKIENFFKGHIGEIEKWMQDLTPNEKAFMFSICPYICYESCAIQYSNGKDIGTEELVKITGLRRNLLYQTIEMLVKKDIIYKGKNSISRQYFVNPWLFCKGNRINKVLKTMFKNYKIRIFGGIAWKDMKKMEE
jgi:hypothetical protein